MTGAKNVTAWEAVADLLAHLGVGTVFGLPGDDMALLGVLEKRDTAFVACRDQRNALFMAVGHALATGKPGVCVVGKGPALVNALTGLLEAQAAAAPVLLLATGTALDKVGTGAFQEADQLAAVRPFVRWAARVDVPERLPAVLDKAVAIAINGTPGPVYVELAEQVVDARFAFGGSWRPARAHRLGPDPEVLAETARRVTESRRPLILAGGGTRHRNEDGLIERLAERIGAGLFVTASGRGAVDEGHPLFCGVAGLYCVDAALALWRDADLVLALGSRVEETAAFGWPKDGPEVIQVVADAAEVNTARSGSHVLGDVARTVAGWLDVLEASERRDGWSRRARDARRSLLAASRRARSALGPGELTVRDVLAALDAVLPADRVLVQENGLQDMWSYFFPYWSCSRGGSVVPSEQTPLGFGAAAAVGVALAVPDRPVAALVGDGAFNLFRAELPTLADSGARVLYVVLDNGGYGWLQWNLERVSGLGSRFAFTSDRPTGTAGPAAACGIPCHRVETPADLAPAMRAAWETGPCAGRPAVVEVRCRLADLPPGMSGSAGDFPVRDETP